MTCLRTAMWYARNWHMTKDQGCSSTAMPRQLTATSLRCASPACVRLCRCVAWLVCPYAHDVPCLACRRAQVGEGTFAGWELDCPNCVRELLEVHWEKVSRALAAVLGGLPLA